MPRKGGVKENLKPFVKGVDARRNVKGQPKKLPAISELIDKVLGSDESGKSEAEAILNALRLKARRGDVRAAELLLDRAYGKARQSVEVTGKNGEPISVIFTKSDGCENVNDAGS